MKFNVLCIIAAYRETNLFVRTVCVTIILFIRLVFSRFLDFRGNLVNVKEKRTRKTCFSRKKNYLATHIYLVKF